MADILVLERRFVDDDWDAILRAMPVVKGAWILPLRAAPRRAARSGRRFIFDGNPGRRSRARLPRAILGRPFQGLYIVEKAISTWYDYRVTKVSGLRGRRILGHLPRTAH